MTRTFETPAAVAGLPFRIALMANVARIIVVLRAIAFMAFPVPWLIFSALMR
jgi:hypothetical protein